MSNAAHQNRRALSATELVTQLSKLNGEQGAPVLMGGIAHDAALSMCEPIRPSRSEAGGCE